MRLFVCKQCGVEKRTYGVRGPLRVYCDPCQKQRRKEYLAKYEQRRKAAFDLPAFE